MSTDMYVPIEQVAKQYSVSVSTVRMWTREGYIHGPAVLRLGGTYRYNLQKVQECLTSVPQPDDKVEENAPVQGELDLSTDKDA
jgi:excisionase family DNA binding protein